MEYKYKVNGVEYTVQVASVYGNKAHVFVNGVSYEVEMEGNTIATPVALAPVAASVPLAPASSVAAVEEEKSPSTQTPEPVQETPKAAPADIPAGGAPVKSPLPGIINDVKVAVGDKVKNGQVLLILEAMKMENEITAEQDGVVSSIAVNKGDTVMEGTVLLTIA